MKKHLVLCFCILYSIHSFATHLRGAEITFRVIGNYQIEATLTTYSKYDGISMLADRNSERIDWGDGTFDSVCRTNGPINASGCHDGVIIATNPVSIKKNTYISTHTYSGLSADGFYVISYFEQNRIDGIANIDAGNSVNIPLYVEDTIFSASFTANLPSNSSPVFLTPPIDYANLNESFIYNPVIFDADGDSVSVELIPPLQSQGVSVPQYSYPAQYCQANNYPNNSFQINPQTAQIVWNTPCQMGIFIIAVLVKEYRCGVPLSTVERDMQIIATNESDSPPTISFIRDTVIQPGDSISMSVTANDANVGQIVSLTAMGGAFLSTQRPPAFQSTSGNTATGILTWQTDSTSARQHAYIFSIVASDNYTIPEKSYQTFRVWVVDTSACLLTGISQIPNPLTAFSIYPNPANNSVTLSVDQSMIGGTVTVSDITGRKMMAVQLSMSNYQLSIKDFSNGVYFVTVTDKAGTSTTKKLVVSK